MFALEEVLGSIGEREVHLAVSATSPPSFIDACFRRHEKLKIDRLIFTKIDEVDDLSELIRTPARLGRPSSYITNGQRVPEDIEEPTAVRLLELATSGMRSEVAA